MPINEESRVTTFLFDLDGVIRIYSDKDTNVVETKYGLEPGIIDRTAFCDDLLTRVTTGQLRRDEWVRMVGIRINNLQAALDWENRPVHIDYQVLEIIRKLKSRGFQICLITNGTDNLQNELWSLGIGEEFGYIFNSAELGVAKPSPKIYSIVLSRCKLKPENVVYIDDNRENVFEAQKLGIKSLHYKGVNTLKDWLENHFFQLD